MILCTTEREDTFGTLQVITRRAQRAAVTEPARSGYAPKIRRMSMLMASLEKTSERSFCRYLCGRVPTEGVPRSDTAADVATEAIALRSSKATA